MKICRKVDHDKTILDIKQNFATATDVIDNGVIMMKFELFHGDALSFKSL